MESLGIWAAFTSQKPKAGGFWGRLGKRTFFLYIFPFCVRLKNIWFNLESVFVPTQIKVSFKNVHTIFLTLPRGGLSYICNQHDCYFHFHISLFTFTLRMCTLYFSLYPDDCYFSALPALSVSSSDLNYFCLPQTGSMFHSLYLIKVGGEFAPGEFYLHYTQGFKKKVLHNFFLLLFRHVL